MSWVPLTAPGAARPARIGETLDRVLAGLGAPPASTLEVVERAWPDLVGPAAAAALRPRSIQGGTLVVTATDPVWAGQARWEEEKVVAGLERLLGPGVVTALEARVEARRRR
jgi:predicted nucleic acid-binding Zn ribbon protein